jgi:predicted N-acetyltransferase YhbS
MINIRILKKSDNREGFSCGEIELDYFFQKYVGQNQFKHYIGVTYIATDEERIFGFATLSVATLSREDFPLKNQKKLPCYPLPVLKLSRMGVDIKYQGKGIGLSLIKMVFKLALEQKEKVGCIGVVVDAKEDAVEFYKKLGFIELDAKSGTVKRYPMPVPMFISIGLLQSAL